jgi:hypothetical protein
MEMVIQNQKIRVKPNDSEFWYSIPLINIMIKETKLKNTLERRDEIGKQYT